MSRERQQSSREDPAGEISLEERQEEPDKGRLASKQLPSPQQDSRRARQERDAANRSPRCCHNASPRTCARCVRRAQRRGSQDGHEAGESPRRGTSNRIKGEGKGMRKDMQRNEEEEEKGGLCGLESSSSVWAVPDPELESNHSHPESNSSCDGEETGKESNEELKTQTSQSKDDYSEKEEDNNSEVMKLDTGNNDSPHGHSGQGNVTLGLNRDLDDRKPSENPCEEVAPNMNGCPDQSGADQNTDTERESVDVEEKEGSINRTPVEFPVFSDCYEEVSVSISTAVSLELSTPVEGSTFNTDHEICVQREQVNSRTDPLEGYQQGVADPGIVAKGKLDLIRLVQPEPNCAAAESNTVNTNRKPLFSFQNAGNGSVLQEREASSKPPGHRDPSISETDGRNVTGNDCKCSPTELNRAGPRDELVLGNREAELHEGDTEEKEDTSGEILRRECTCFELDNAEGKGDKERNAEGPTNESSIQEDNDKKETENCAQMDNWRVEESAGGCRGRGKEVVDTCGQSAHVEATGETGSTVACADPPTSLALSLANPAPTFQPLSSMETILHCLEENVEKKRVGVLEGDEKGGQEGKKRLRRLLEEQGEAERVSTVATEEEGREEEGKDEEDEFGVFMQAEGELAWSEGSTTAPVPCGSRERVAHGSRALAGEPTHWTPGWTDSLIHQSDDRWTAFPQDWSDEGGDMVGQWWPTSAVEERREPANQNLAAVFAAAFPSSSDDPGDLQTVPTLSQLLRGRASQEQGLLDTFHDLNKMICQKYKRGNGVSRDLLLRTFHLEPPRTSLQESRPPQRTANHRLSPGLPSTNQHAHNAAAKRRLSYDYNRNME